MEEQTEGALSLQYVDEKITGLSVQSVFPGDISPFGAQGEANLWSGLQNPFLGARSKSFPVPQSMLQRSWLKFQSDGF